VGGFSYKDPSGRTFQTSSSFDSLVRTVKSFYLANGWDIPANLEHLIEDQICTRQPPDRCYYTKGLGDRVSLVIHSIAGAVDKVAGTKLEKKARGCGGCGQRRMSMNSR
jgi:hypothetical protein